MPRSIAKPILTPWQTSLWLWFTCVIRKQDLSVTDIAAILIRSSVRKPSEHQDFWRNSCLSTTQKAQMVPAATGNLSRQSVHVGGRFTPHIATMIPLSKIISSTMNVPTP